MAYNKHDFQMSAPAHPIAPSNETLVDHLSHVPNYSLDWIDLYLKLGSSKNSTACLAGRSLSSELKLTKFVPPSYERMSAHRLYGRPLSQWINFLQPNLRFDMQSAIDIGGGVGLHLLQLGKESKVQKLVLVEPNVNLLDSARRNASDASLEITIFEGGSHQIPMDFHRSFDIVISNLVMPFVRSPMDHLIALKNLLRPRGFISLQDFFVPESMERDAHWLLRETTTSALQAAQRPLAERLFQEIMPMMGMQIRAVERNVLTTENLTDAQLRAWNVCGEDLKREFSLRGIEVPALNVNHYILYIPLSSER